MPEFIIYSEKENELFESIEALKTKDLSQIENDSNDEFISLHDFLEQAEYVGKTFVRTEALGTDNRYISELGNVLALYKLGNIIITVDSSAVSEKKLELYQLSI